jgi:hypothetical protein
MNRFPFRVTLLLALVLSLTMWNMLRLWTSLAWRATLTEFAGAQISAVITISAAVWTLVGIFVAWSILQRKPWAAKTLAAAAGCYSIWYWIERLVWQNPRPNWVFAVIVNLALIIFIPLNIKTLSREAYERKIENPAIE